MSPAFFCISLHLPQLAHILVARRKFQAAEPLCQQLLQNLDKNLNGKPDTPQVAAAAHLLADIMAEMGKVSPDGFMSPYGI